jgi:hemolysin activation/secretion protein
VAAKFFSDLASSRSVALLVTLLAASSPRAAEQEERFDVWEYRVLGNSVLQPAQIETLMYPKLGSNRSLADVEEARKALEALYRDNGYGAVFVDVPEQDVAGGVVRLKVTEGRLDRVRITGARYFANGRIRDSVPALQPGKVVNLPQLQQQLMDVNRQSADRQITPVLRAGREPGAVDIDLKVKDTLPLHASVEVNDRYTANTSRTRASANLSYDNLFQSFNRLSLQYQTSPEEPDETRVIAGTYIAPLPGTGNLLAVYAVDTKSDFATIGSIGTLSVLGTGQIYGARYIAVLPELPGYFHSVTLGADFKDFTDSIVQPDGTPDTTPMRYANWSALYSGNLRTERTASSMSIGANFGIRGLGNDQQEFEYKRYKAQPNYFYLRADATHERPLLWGTSVFLRAAGQFTTEPLISNEQFSIGGADSVRGYLESSELGDTGASGSFELRSPQFTAWLPDLLQQLYFFTFYDGGVIGVIDPLVFEGEKVSRVYLTSWGAGVRLAAFGGLEAGLDWGYPLQSTDAVERGDARVHFQVRYGF